MLDFLTIKKDHTLEYTEGFQHIEGEHARVWDRLPGSGPYEHFVDLRLHGINAELYRRNRYDGSDGIQIVGCGFMSAPQITQELKRIVDDPANARVLRTDLAADVKGIPADWFRKHMRVRYLKQTGQHWDNEARSSLEDGTETVYYGTANSLKFYDKVAQLEFLVKKERANPIQKRLLAEYHSSDVDVTRIERTFAGRSVPKHLRTLNELLGNAADFDAFENVDLLPGGKPLPALSSVRKRRNRYLTGRGLRDLIEDVGLHDTVRFLNGGGSRNARVTLSRYAEFLPESDFVFDVNMLRQIYCESTLDQLSGAYQRRYEPLTVEKSRTEYDVIPASAEVLDSPIATDLDRCALS